MVRLTRRAPIALGVELAAPVGAAPRAEARAAREAEGFGYRPSTGGAPTPAAPVSSREAGLGSPAMLRFVGVPSSKQSTTPPPRRRLAPTLL